MRNASGSESAPAASHDEDAPTGMYPVVMFSNGVERVITPESWQLEQGNKVVAQRVQVPREKYQQPLRYQPSWLPFSL